ncbi:4-carboxymuconolactone decarboxylase-like protein [Lepidopterella palustris CBS 459.81]|uniref:4-carboxymuconolactone decarboxylase-like protein n=1 Tax=Lepidopterella palustris CBS 459.81 TaxID=1314670 RepID=A0A8E2JKC1_9PEZI|nr:4-carboxymuconolactone decarboxylase-like protein [Lepidopterella palustris CBS 459.81]
MRLPYAPTTPPDPSSAPIYERIAARRSPRPLIPLDLALLHSPQVADGWNSFIGAIRTKISLDNSIKELAICRVAVLNSAVHEWNAHAPLAMKGGISPAGLESARRAEVVGRGEIDKVPEEDEGGLNAREWAVLAYTDQMTRGVEVDEAVFARLKEYLVDKEVVEITATVAAYNCVSRFLVALDVGENNGKDMKSMEEFTG